MTQPGMRGKIASWQRSAPLALLLLALGAGWAGAQSVAIRGSVTDSATAEPLSGVHVSALAVSGVPLGWALSGDDGRFSVTVPAGVYTLTFRRIGYVGRRLPGLQVDSGRPTLDVALAAIGVPLDPVVISASRLEQTALDAPASATVVDRRKIADAVGFTPLDELRTVTGVDVASKGLIQQSFAVRGSSGVNAGGLLLLTDFRYAALPSIGFNIPYLVPATREDIERVEVVRGPAAALYGPGAARGIVHIISRSPFESPGGTLSLTAGARSVVEGSARFAAILTPRLAFAVSGDYFRGHDWESTDSKEVGNRDTAIATGADPDTLRIGRRDFTIGRAGGEARLDWRPSDGTEVVAKAGVADALRNIDLTSEVGAVQVRDWRYTFFQGTLRRGRLFTNLVYNLSDAGATYVLRTGKRLVDQSRVVAAQLQHGATLGPVDLLYGADFRWTDPRTEGTIDGRNEADDRVTEIGSYAHAVTRVGRRLDVVTAVRVDHHDRLNDLVVSPRAGIVFKAGTAHAFRLTYNRAFTSPDPSDLFADILADSLRPLPYGVRAFSIPRDGFSFRRDCGGLCMRSPLNPGGADQYLPADATLLWPRVVRILQQQGIDLSGIPEPTAANVATRLAALNPGTGKFDLIAAADIRGVPALRRTITTAFELGYKGVAANRIGIAVDLYVNRVTDPRGDMFAITPNVFYDSATLANHLGSYLPASQAAQVAAAVAQIPVGTVSPAEAGYPVDVLLVRRQGGAYTLWGGDARLTVTLSAPWSVEASYSWVSSDSIAGVQNVGDLVLNVPRNKGSLALLYRNSGLSAALEGRAVAGFPVASGDYNGRTASYGVLDARIGFRLPGRRDITVTLDARNLLDRRHEEIIGAPALGRLVVSRIRVVW